MKFASHAKKSTFTILSLNIYPNSYQLLIADRFLIVNNMINSFYL